MPVGPVFVFEEIVNDFTPGEVLALFLELELDLKPIPGSSPKTATNYVYEQGFKRISHCNRVVHVKGHYVLYNIVPLT